MMMETQTPTATRKDLQIGRRLFHFAGGMAVVVAYGVFFTHARAVYLLGTIACIIYVFDKFRIAYPEIATQFEGITNFFIRAEERLQESSMIPYVIAVLLTIISFPKPIALMAIATLALADPLSAIIGVRYGKHHLVKEKTIEGSLAFFCAAFLCSFLIVFKMVHETWVISLIASFMISVAVTAFEMLPVKLDDNLTIPLFMGFMGWIFYALLGIPT